MAARRPAAKRAARKQPAVKRRRTQAQMFMDELRRLSGEEQALVPNLRLRDSLGWDEVRYKSVKSRLNAEGLLVIGRGHGGSVGLARPEEGDALKVFVSYSHADEKLKDAVMSHLRPLERLKLIAQWNDRKLLAGDKWEQEISTNLESADIVLILVSIDFLNSKYCYDIEMERAIIRHAEGSCRVIPIILRGCLWQHAPFAKIQALPRDGKPVTTWPDLDESLASVAEAIRLAAEDILASR